MSVSVELTRCSPCLIVADGDPVRAGRVARSFRRLGWDAYSARSGPEVRRLARMLGPELVILDTLLPEESGWLTCEKLTRELPDIKVVLVDPAPDAKRQGLAAFVGASGLAGREDGAGTLLRRAGCLALTPAR